MTSRWPTGPLETIGLGHWNDHRPRRVEKDVSYRGEHVSTWSFFYSFREIICRRHGSIIPDVWLQITIATLLGVFACAMVEYPQHFPAWLVPTRSVNPLGHQIIGVMLAFLVVFVVLAGASFTENVLFTYSSAMCAYLVLSMHVEMLLVQLFCR